MDLMGADALLAAAQQVRRQKPLVQRNVRTLVDGADGDRELALAGVAVVEAGLARLAADGTGALDLTAMRAVPAVGPARGLQILASLRLVGENRVGEIGAHG
jgi:hypothetical protein